MKCFVDTSVLIEHIKGNKTDLLAYLFDKYSECIINHIVFSEFMYHYLGAITGKSPLTVKETKQIPKTLKKNDVLKFISLFKITDLNEGIMKRSYQLMKKYNLLPNDAIILASCRENKIKVLASYDSDFRAVCKSENIELISEI